MTILSTLVVVAAMLAIAGFRVCQEYERAVVFRLGRFQAVRGPGWYWNIPLLEWQRKLDLRTCTVDIEQQETVSRDSVTIKVNAVLWYRVFDPKLADRSLLFNAEHPDPNHPLHKFGVEALDAHIKELAS